MQEQLDLRSSAWFSKYSTAITSLDLQVGTCRTEQMKLKNDFVKFVGKSKTFLNALKEDMCRIKETGQPSGYALHLHNLVSGREPPDKPPGVDLPDFRFTGEAEKYINRVKANYDEAMNILTRDLSETKAQNSEFKKNCTEMEKLIATYRTQIHKYEDTWETKEKESIDLISEMEQAKDKIINLEIKLSNQQRVLGEIQEENVSLKVQNDDLTASVTELNEKLVQLEIEQKSSRKMTKKTLFDIQEALLQKKASAYKEQRAMNFADHLKSSLKKEIDLAVCLQKQGMIDIQKQCSVKMTQLTDELQSLQVENTEKQILFEKAIREKNFLESKLKSVDAPEKTRVSLTTLQKLYRDIFQLEKQKEACDNEIRCLNNSIHTLRKSHANETQFFQLETEKLRQELQSSNGKLSETIKDKEFLVDQVAELKKQSAEMQKLLEGIESQQKRELFAVTHLSEHHVEALQLQLKISEEKYSKNFLNFRELLGVQHQVCDKWKEALQECTAKSEFKIKQLHQDLYHLQQQNESLNNMLRRQHSSLNIL